MPYPSHHLFLLPASKSGELDMSRTTIFYCRRVNLLSMFLLDSSKGFIRVFLFWKENI